MNRPSKNSPSASAAPSVRSTTTFRPCTRAGCCSLDTPVGRGEDSGSLAGAIAANDDDPTANVDAHEDRERLMRAISELSENDRNVVILYYHEQLYLKEIGEILGVTESRVSQILTRALERLRRKLKTED